MYKQLTDRINYYELESAILRFWEENNIFEKSIESRNGKPKYTFYEGPPTANGRPGIHHVMARTLKDIICRYKTMQGFQVPRKAGWDTHGLPVEIEVEKELGFKRKDEILKYGVARFNEECKKSVWKYKSDWEKLTRIMGYWVDLEKAYITFENYYIESVWWALKQFFDRGMIFRDFKIQPYCPRCETPLSSHEVSLGYKDVKDPSIYIKLKSKDEDNTYYLVWTTTPWTLISNVALAVNPEVEYVKIEHKGEYLILAEARLSVIDGDYNVVQKFKGASLEGKEYERIYSYQQTKEKGWYVVLGDFVTTEDGTGIVHIAPAYGEDDYRVGKKYSLPTIHPVNKSGEFNSEVKDFAGKFVKDADPEIIQNLRVRGILYKKEQYLHSYPHCWRCSSPLLYYARESWYIRTTQYANKMIELNKQINWVPPEVGEGRFGNWLKENKDWALSRDRFWGTPLPIWVCERCDKEICIGSINELQKGKNVPEPLDLHKPFVDEIVFDCDCGGTMKRTPELIDVWFDSGAMPFAQWHYPFENKDVFENSYPADFISEGIDQTRGWFYTLHAIGTFLFAKPAFKNVLVNELILDKHGQKMSKSRGNTVDPFELIQRHGADSVRWYLISQSPVWRPTLFDEEGIKEVQRKFFSTLLNTYSFFALYANVDGFNNSEPLIPVKERQEIDQWIISELNSLVKYYVKSMDEYDITRSARAVSDFTIDKLSNWYVRRNRRRFWKSEKGKDKTAAYQTLHECLITIARLIAPFSPFIAEELYRNLSEGSKNRLESVHLDFLPVVNEQLINKELEDRMQNAIRIVGLVRSMRMKANLKVRQPLRRIIVPVKSESEKKKIMQMQDIILDEINVKRIEYVTDEASIVKKRCKPNFKTLGPKFGKSVQSIAVRIKEMSPDEIKNLQANGNLTLRIDGNEYRIDLADVEIIHEDIEGWLVESDGQITVALDTTLTEDLINEGFAREFVNRVQNLRKETGLEVIDRIRIMHSSSDRLSKAIEKMAVYIKQETLAVEITNVPSEKLSEYKFVEADINGEPSRIAVEKI